ncbi:hypothetical protein [Streptomyces shenzhenensis]|uniref:Uncharacterized protein n=1 Tax=Streptomyces shenzhenensis TaxID=943815 RepID=A0A3M0I4E1_9ACTN|nr:hypothetical protein [Streptomyces shenzhenensis]RMB83634.1 hypothetical protein CTZ28_23230 [Streptomyces shenzhenensis]
MTAPSLDVPPGPGFVATIAAVTAVQKPSDGLAVAQLLITHPGPRRQNETVETVEDGMRRLATALHLGPGEQEPPVIGGKLMIRRGFAALDYGHDRYVMTIPSPSQDWLALVGAGGACRICLVFAPLAVGADQAETDAHLRASFERGQVRWGTTYARRRF